MIEVSGLLLWVVYASLIVISFALVAALVRVLQGPSLADRIVALDLVAYLAMGFLGAYALLVDQETYIDAALVLGLLAFLGTVAVARYIERMSSGEGVTEP
jgi:multicomponent Na+:H+ antiporter subunit F